MNNKLFVLVLLALLIPFTESCRKKGCMDDQATNYDEKAKKDDGSCEYDEDELPKLRFKFTFDATQERLDNFGNPVSVPTGHGAQSPSFNLMGAHYIELSEADDIPAYNGLQLYNSPTTSAGGSLAIIFDSAAFAGNNEEFFALNVKDVTPGTYEYVRVSLIYQNYDIDFRANGYDLSGTIASFVGANNYITSYTIKNETVTVNGNKLQGYWGFETDFAGVPVSEGQAPGTTVPNPISSTSPVAAGSCLVTGVFSTPFTITGNETDDITIVCSISINNSFEWTDAADNNIYEPLDGDTVVDMGVRGLIPIVQ